VSRSLLVLLVVAGPLSAADDPKLPGPKIEFPDVKGFTRGKPRTFPQAEFGYALGYNAEEVVVTVYVYSAGHKEIPAGAKSDLVKKEMEGAAKAMQDALKAGFYKSVKEVGKDETVAIGRGKDAPVALRRKFEVEGKEGGASLSETYLTGYKDHFVKLRVTYAAENKDEARKKLATLLDSLGAALK
jgi:hypothetical protein